MKDFLDPTVRRLWQRHGLDSFAALWEMQLPAVDQPNSEQGGWSQVFRLELDGEGFFVKRQCNYFTRSPRHPFGEPTVAREFRTIARYRRLAIPSVEAVFAAARRVAGECRAILVTRALDGWVPLEELLESWPVRTEAQRRELITTCAGLVGRLHGSGLRHGCLYPKHLFLCEEPGAWRSCLIDLEKTRRLWPGWRDRVRDLETFLRTVRVWNEAEQRQFLAGYLQASGARGVPELWLARLERRRRHKERHR